MESKEDSSDGFAETVTFLSERNKYHPQCKHQKMKESFHEKKVKKSFHFFSGNLNTFQIQFFKLNNALKILPKIY